MFDTEKFIIEVEQRPPLYNVTCKEYSNREIKAKCWIDICKIMFEDWENCATATKDERARELMKKWKTIRDAFVRDHKKVTAVETGKSGKKQKRYVFYNQLQFLLPHVKGNANTASNIPDLPPASETDNEMDMDESEITNIDEGDDEALFESSASEQQEPSSSKGKRKPNSPHYRPNKKMSIEQSVASSAKQLTLILSESLNLQKKELEREQEIDKFGHKQFLTSFIPILDNLPLHAAMAARLQISEVINRIVQTQNSSFPSYPIATPNTATTVDEMVYDEEENSFNVSKYAQL